MTSYPEPDARAVDDVGLAALVGCAVVVVCATVAEEVLFTSLRLWGPAATSCSIRLVGLLPLPSARWVM
ncbi:hypothetical protein D3C84_1278160 [compost metagenome]